LLTSRVHTPLPRPNMVALARCTSSSISLNGIQVSRIVARPTFGSGKVRGASNIAGLSDTE
jgi:hypothetical protein